jgi:hypothetical protein
LRAHNSLVRVLALRLFYWIAQHKQAGLLRVGSLANLVAEDTLVCGIDADGV